MSYKFGRTWKDAIWTTVFYTDIVRKDLNKAANILRIPNKSVKI
jgi:hypothetical protein